MSAHDPDQQSSKHDKTSVAPTQTEPLSEIVISPSEQQLLQFLHDGLSIEQIAQRRNRRPGTVANQLSALYRKLGVNTRAKAIALTMPWLQNKTLNR